MNRREKEKKLEMLRTLVKSPYNYQVPQLMSLVDIGHSTFYDWVKKYGLKKPVSRPMQFNSDWKNLFLLNTTNITSKKSLQTMDNFMKIPIIALFIKNEINMDDSNSRKIINSLYKMCWILGEEPDEFFDNIVHHKKQYNKFLLKFRKDDPDISDENYRKACKKYRMFLGHEKTKYDDPYLNQINGKPTNHYPDKLKKWEYLEKHPTCEGVDCNGKKCTNKATEVNHIQPVKIYPEFANGIINGREGANFQAFCGECHLYWHSCHEDRHHSDKIKSVHMAAVNLLQHHIRIDKKILDKIHQDKHLG